MVFLSRINHWATSASAIALVAGLVSSCAPSAPPTAPGAGGSPAATTGTTGGGTVVLNGAGASAPNPLYQRWFADYNKVDQAVQISYQSVGSGAGVKQFLEQTVDFGATDDPIKSKDAEKYPQARGAAPVQIPTTGLFVVFAYNLEGVDGLKLSRETFCAIADGSIKTWNDPKITKDNAGVNLPDTPVTWVYRSDGSGTTAIFTNHLAKACPNWKAGSGKSIEWPAGTGAKGNEGVTSQIQQTPGGIGYTEFSFAKENNLKMATVQNKAGDFIAPSPEAAAKALAGIEPDKSFAVKVPDPEQKDAYPIVSLTYLLLYEQYPDQSKADALKKMVNWALKDGKAAATELGYIPLPDEIVTKVATQLDTIKVASK
jgi:phosphate transport system substrate-binding protein